jgi:hypothetical protein
MDFMIEMSVSMSRNYWFSPTASVGPIPEEKLRVRTPQTVAADSQQA